MPSPFLDLRISGDLKVASETWSIRLKTKRKKLRSERHSRGRISSRWSLSDSCLSLRSSACSSFGGDSSTLKKRTSKSMIKHAPKQMSTSVPYDLPSRHVLTIAMLPFIVSAGGVHKAAAPAMFFNSNCLFFCQSRKASW
jgi:hypothetical protein